MRWRLALVVLAACGARTELDTPRASTDASTNGCGASLASGPSWTTTFGPAQYVCLSASEPGCPSGAFIYGAGMGWSANLSSLGGAFWIWRPGISTSDPADNVEVTFTRTFVLAGVPSGTLSIAADDEADVVVNGAVVGSVGSTTSVSAALAAQSALTTFDLGPHLVAGANTIAVVARNGPSYFAGCPGACTYAQNLAGVVFGGVLECK